MTESEEASPGGSFRRLRRDLVAILLLGLAAWRLPALAGGWARPALLNLGPNDWDYVRGFREQWERDGRTRFHWTGPSATVRLPLGINGPGALLRLRVRRHFLDPAHVRLIVEGRTVSRFDLSADPKVAYRVIETKLPELDGRRPFVLVIEAPSENPRPLGIALDWMEVERGAEGAVFTPEPRLPARALFVVLIAYIVPRLAGSSRLVALLHAAVLGLTVVFGTAWDLVASERILREGGPTYAAGALVALGLVRWRRSRSALGIPSAGVAGGLALTVLAALAIRLALLLHPQFYYPDVNVHGLFAWQLARRGVQAFLEDFTVNQYRYSLGLQFESGHWYAFPYPPAFYLLAGPLVRWGGYHHNVAVSLVAAAVNGLEVLLVFGVARRLNASAASALASAAAVPLLPLFLARLTLAYFPAIVGHAVDALALLYLLSRLDRLERPSVILTLAGLLTLALLTYTQSLLNFAVILSLFLALQFVFDRRPGARARQAGLAAAGVLSVLLALVVFYGRYIPIFLDMRRGIPMPEERVLLEKLERSRPPDEEAAPEEPDPYAGPELDLLRGVRKAGWRLYVFYGVFAPVIVVGLGLLLRRLEGARARVVVAWALTYLLLNLASGGLPSPNLVRYNKDLEVVAPLVCVALGTLWVWLWERGRVWGILYGAAFYVFGAIRAGRSLLGTFVLER